MITRKKLLWFFLFCLVFAWFGKDGQAQVSFNVIIPTTPPGGVGGACTSRAIAYLMPLTGGNQLITCDPSSHLWTTQSGGGGGGTPSTPLSSFQFDNNGAFGGSATAILQTTALATPAAPGLTKNGTGTGTTWGYEVVARNIIGGTASSAEATIDGNATLDMTHSVTVTPPACAAAAAPATSYDVYRTTAGGTPATTGLIGSAACSGTLIDTGLTVSYPFTSAPSVNTSTGSGSSIPYVNTSIGSCFGSLCQANNDSTFWFSNSSTGLGVFQNTSAAGYDYITMLVETLNDRAGGSTGHSFVSEISYTASPLESQSDAIIGEVTANIGGITVPAPANAFDTNINIVAGNTFAEVNGFVFEAPQNQGTITLLQALNIHAPGATIGAYTTGYALHIADWSTQTWMPTAYAIKVDGGLSQFDGGVKATTYSTATNCADSAGAAACGSAAAGRFVADASATSVVVSTTAVTANSEIFIEYDSSLSAALSVTCNATIPSAYAVTARTAATSFTLTTTANVANPGCFSYHIVN